jgi:hypothetical protein
MTIATLFPVALQGIGSSEIESFPSYLHRLAYAHGIYVGELLKFSYKYAVKEKIIRNIYFLPHYITVSELIRPEKVTSMLVDLFHQLTDQKLEGSVLWFFENCLGRSAGEIVEGFRWCPECFSEILNMGDEAYFKLIWHLTAISACPIHRTPLINKCEFCGCTQTSYIKSRAIGFCQDCGKSLSGRKKKLRPIDIIRSWEDIGLDIVELFKDMASLQPNSLPVNGIHKSVEDIFDYYWRVNREDEFYTSLSRDELLAIVYKQAPVSLKSARRIAYRLGIALCALLSGDAAKTSNMLDHEQFCTLPPGYLDASKKTKKDHMVILNKIKVELKNSKAPPSLKRLAKQVCVSIGYLEYRHPVLVANVVARHQAYCEEMMLKKLHKAQSSSLDFFLNEKYDSQTKSRKQAYRTLRAETGLPKHILKRAIQTAYAALHKVELEGILG